MKQQNLTPWHHCSYGLIAHHEIFVLDPSLFEVLLELFQFLKVVALTYFHKHVLYLVNRDILQRTQPFEKLSHPRVFPVCCRESWAHQPASELQTIKVVFVVNKSSYLPSYCLHPVEGVSMYCYIRIHIASCLPQGLLKVHDEIFYFGLVSQLLLDVVENISMQVNQEYSILISLYSSLW